MCDTLTSCQLCSITMETGEVVGEREGRCVRWRSDDGISERMRKDEKRKRVLRV